MSAWLVSRRHIDAIAGFPVNRTPSGTFGCGPRAHVARVNREARKAAKVHNYALATALGRILWAENVKSLRARYPSHAAERDRADAEAAAYTFTALDLDALAKSYNATADGLIHHAIACLDYQSCEHAGWRKSTARWLLDKAEHAILERAIAPQVGKHGYLVVDGAADLG